MVVGVNAPRPGGDTPLLRLPGMHTAVHTAHISVGVRSPPLTLWCDFVQGDMESEEDFSEWALGPDGLPVSLPEGSDRRHPR